MNLSVETRIYTDGSVEAIIVDDGDEIAGIHVTRRVSSLVDPPERRYDVQARAQRFDPETDLVGARTYEIQNLRAVAPLVSVRELVL